MSEEYATQMQTQIWSYGKHIKKNNKSAILLIQHLSSKYISWECSKWVGPLGVVVSNEIVKGVFALKDPLRYGYLSKP